MTSAFAKVASMARGLLPGNRWQEATGSTRGRGDWAVVRPAAGGAGLLLSPPPDGDHAAIICKLLSPSNKYLARVMNRLFLITSKLGSFYCLFINYLLVSNLFLLATLQLRTTKD